MQELIKTGTGLYKYFDENIDLAVSEISLSDKVKDIFVFVSSKIMKDVLTSVRQGILEKDGYKFRIYFENIGAGVWKAKLNRFW